MQPLIYTAKNFDDLIKEIQGLGSQCLEDGQLDDAQQLLYIARSLTDCQKKFRTLSVYKRLTQVDKGGE